MWATQVGKNFKKWVIFSEVEVNKRELKKKKKHIKSIKSQNSPWRQKMFKNLHLLLGPHHVSVAEWG